jgi:putative aldouronate transport system substrate-binding protein
LIVYHPINILEGEKQMIRSIRKNVQKNKKKSMAMALVLGLSASLALTGCSNNDSASSDKKADAAFHKTGLPIVDKQVTLNIVSPKAALAPDYSKMVRMVPLSH